MMQQGMQQGMKCTPTVRLGDRDDSEGLLFFLRVAPLTSRTHANRSHAVRLSQRLSLGFGV